MIYSYIFLYCATIFSLRKQICLNTKFYTFYFFLEVIEAGKVSHPVEGPRVEGEDFVQHING